MAPSVVDSLPALSSDPQIDADVRRRLADAPLLSDAQIARVARVLREAVL